MEKKYISPEQLLEDSFTLALNIVESGFRPDLIVGVWRGGTPVGIAVQEVLEFLGINCDHISIRTSSYTSIGERTQVEVHGLGYLENKLSANDSLLLVDDVFDTGLSLDEVIKEINILYCDSPPKILIAVPWYKPENNQTSRQPDYHLHKTTQWLVFPHEIQGLTDSEIKDHKPGLNAIKARLLKLKQLM